MSDAGGDDARRDARPPQDEGQDLAERIGISETQFSLLRSGKVKGVRLATLAKLCAVLDCKPADVLDYDYSEADLNVVDAD